MSKSKFLDICNVVFDAAQDDVGFNSLNPLAWNAVIFTTSGVLPGVFCALFDF